MKDDWLLKEWLECYWYLYLLHFAKCKLLRIAKQEEENKMNQN